MSAADPAYVRDQLDKILAREITSFIAIDSDVARLDYNLATIACKQNELVDPSLAVTQRASSPPEGDKPKKKRKVVRRKKKR